MTTWVSPHTLMVYLSPVPHPSAPASSLASSRGVDAVDAQVAGVGREGELGESGS